MFINKNETENTKKKKACKHSYSMVRSVQTSKRFYTFVACTRNQADLSLS